MNERDEIEAGIEQLLAPVKAAGFLKSIVSIGGQDYGDVLRAVLGMPPFAMIKFEGASTPGIQGTGVKDWTAEISVLIGAKSYKSMTDQRKTIFAILAEVKSALDGKRIGDPDMYWPLDLRMEQWSAMSGGSIEAWLHQYTIKWREVLTP